MRSTVLELAILGSLKEQPLHGYELKKRLAETLGLVASVSFGSLYPALARLEGAGAVRVLTGGGTGGGADHGVDRIPMTGSLGGERAAFRAGGPGARGLDRGHLAGRGPRPTRQRKVYAITEPGLALFDQLLGGGDVSPEDDRGFALRLALARHLSSEGRLRLLEQRRDLLAERRDRPSGPVSDTWAEALAERRAEALDADIAWLDRLILAERAQRPPAVPRGCPSASTAHRQPSGPKGPERKASTA